MKSLEIEIYHHTEESAVAEEVGVNVPLKDCDIKPMTFYNISSVGPYIEDDFEGSIIFSGHSSFITPISYNVLKEKIDVIWK